MEEDITELFLLKFKQLEEKIIGLSNLKSNYIGFSRALEECKYSKKIPILENNQIYNILKTASDIRNILSHQANACVPSTSFYNKFKIIADEIINPLEVYDICTKKDKIVYANFSTPILDIVEKMVDNHLSHVPIIEKGKVSAVFSQNSFFQYVYVNKSIKVDSTYLIKDYLKQGEYIHINESFIFVSRNTKVSSLLKYMKKKSPTDKKTSVIFITEHGKKDEELLGLITQLDLLKAPLYNY